MMIDEQAVLGLAQQQIREATGGELVVEGDLDLALFPQVIVNLGPTTIDLPPQGADGSRLLAKATEINIGLSLIGALSGADEVGEVRLAGTEVTLFGEDGSVESQVTVSELTAQGLNMADQPMTIQGAIALSSGTDADPLSLKFSGRVRVPPGLDRVTLEGLDTQINGALTEPVSASLSGVANLAPLNADLDLSVQSPGGAIDGDLLYTAKGSPQIDLDFRSDSLNLDRLQPASSGASEPAMATGDQEPPTNPPPMPLPVGPLKDLDLQLKITAGELITSGQTITSAQLFLRVVDGVSDLEYLRGVLHEGQLDTRLTVDVNEPEAEVVLKGGLKGVELNSLLTSLDKPNTAAGYVDMDWSVNTEGESAQDLQLALDGVLNMGGRNVEITSASAQDLMCQAIAKINREALTQPMPPTTEVAEMTLQVKFDDGQAKLTQLDLATPGVAIQGKGAASLSTLDFAATLEASVSEELEQLDPACRVDERYTALRLPVNCAGNLTDETGNLCRVDVEDIARQLLENEARSKLEEKAGSALRKLFGR
jgi:uncharacterized protein involved in outer membrane biogenesis